MVCQLKIIQFDDAFLPTGKQICVFETKSAVRTCGFSYSGQILMYSTDKAMGHGCEIAFYDTRDAYQMSKCVQIEIYCSSVCIIPSLLD